MAYHQILQQWAEAGYPDVTAEFADTLGITKSRLLHTLRRELKLLGYSSITEFRVLRGELPPDDSDQIYDQIFAFIKDEERSLQELCDRFDRGPSTMMEYLRAMEDGGYNVRTGRRTAIAPTTQPVRPIVMPEVLLDDPGTEFCIAVPSDLHFGSKAQQITALHDFCDVARRDFGVRHFLVPGDITAGTRVYRGQEREVWALGAGEQVEATRRLLPVAEEDEFWGIEGGNHDYSHIKHGGIDAVWQICQNDPKLYYLGYSSVTVPLTEQVSARLWHPRGGVPYSVSYRAQKGMESLMKEMRHGLAAETGSRTQLLLVGHLHISMLIPGLTMLAAQCGCFEGQTLYLKEKGYFPDIGGWVFEFRLTKGGLVRRMSAHWLPYDEIEEDWRSYPEAQNLTPPVEEFEPIFSVGVKDEAE